ncbi:MAG: zinc-ribbon domain-containing protein, partial [Rhodomicrobium sp.]|nr:zinc-ribbon domain-containing protein [Rhodomicrobium sp.]
MIIECPACTTRYDIKAALPPEGRKVRCAKCKTEWRAMPVTGEAQAVTAGQEADRSESYGTGAGTWDAGDQDVTHQDAAAWTREPELNQDSAAEAFAGEHAAAAERDPENLAVSGPDAAAENEYGESALSEPLHGPSGWRGDEKDEIVEDNGKVRWFGSFRRKNSFRSGLEADAGTAAIMSAETIPFPRAASIAESHAPADDSDLRTLEEAREAVRSVFSSLGEVRPAGARTVHAPVTAQMPEEDKPAIQGPEDAAQHAFAGTHSDDVWHRGSFHTETMAEAADRPVWPPEADAGFGKVQEQPESGQQLA